MVKEKMTLEEVNALVDEYGNLNLRGTEIKELPAGLTVGGGLYLIGTKIKELPAGLTVGGWLDLRGTKIKELPAGLTVGGSLYLSGTEIKDTSMVSRLRDGDYVEGKYLYADGILTHIKRAKRIGHCTYYVGKIKGRDVIFDGTHYAHCRSIEDGINQLAFKTARDRGAEQYRGVDKDKPMPVSEAKVMYRVITGACEQGTQRFIDSLGELKEMYTVNEIIKMTENQYGGDAFRRFFEE